MRERFRRLGPEGLAGYELLELLLTYAIPRRDVKPLAKTLIERFGSLGGVFFAPLEELQGVRGVGPRTALLLRLVGALWAAVEAEGIRGRDLLSSPERVVSFAKARFSKERDEHFVVLYLNSKNELLDLEVLSKGTVQRAAVYPRRVAEGALRRAATGVILIHNHPSGHPEPSSEDRAVTAQVAAALRPLEVRLIDHLVVAERGYFSFRERGLL